MNINSVNSTNFKGSYFQDKYKDDLEKADRASELLREFDRTFVSNDSDSFEFESEKKAPSKKSKIGVAASIALGFGVLFGLSKKGLNNVSEYMKSVKDIGFVGKTVNSLKDTNAAKAVGASMDNAVKTMQKNSKMVAINKFVTEKIGVDNVLPGAAALAGTVHVVRTDGNRDGYPDIAEHGVNAYRNALKGADMISDIVEVFS